MKGDSESFFHSIFNSVTDGISVIDTEMNILYANRAMEEWQARGLPFVGKKCYQIRHCRNACCDLCPSRKAILTGRPAQRFMSSNGISGPDPRLFHVFCIPFVDHPSGQVRGVIEYVRRIVKTRGFPNTLHNTQEALNSLINAANETSLLIDTEGTILVANETLAQRLGKTVHDIIGASLYTYFSPDVAQYRREQFDRVVRTGKPTRFEDERAGEFYETYCCPVFDKKDKVSKIAIFARNISRHKHTEEALTRHRDDLERLVAERAAELSKSQQLYQTFIDSASDMVFLKDDRLKNVIVNDRLAGFFGKDKSEIRGKSDFELMAVEDAEKCRQTDMETLKKRSVTISEQTVGNRVFETRKFPVMLNKDQMGIGAFIRDITHRKKMEHALQSQFLSLQELNTTLKVLLHQRDEDRKEAEEKYVMNMKSLVLPYIEQLKKGQLDARQMSYVNILQHNLTQITMPFARSVQQLNLNPREIQVASLIKEGKTSKEIGHIMGLATSSVDACRNSIRFKLGLNNRKANLQSYLQSLE